MKLRSSPSRFLGGMWRFLIQSLLFLNWDVGTSLEAFESLGLSSRRTGLVICDIMYHPLPRRDGKNLEFIELFNSEPIPSDISGYNLSGDVDFTFPTNTIVAAQDFLVIAPSPGDVGSA